ncbi:MAG: methyltransferase [Cyclobacteriaceae bacterium]
MANSYFQFKQFRIDQADVAMKVTTDACLFGAWIASLSLRPQRILDIGTGTGLLSLMMAQQYIDARLTALEIESSAVAKANLNFAHSPWSSRLTLHHERLQHFNNDQKYDLIISNPPFFTNSQKARKASQNLAWHAEALNQQDLIAGIKSNLTSDGMAFVIYPASEMQLFCKEAASNQLYAHRIVDVFDRPNSSVLRTMVCFGFKQTETLKESIVIKTDQGEYSEQFLNLLRPYYLHL